MQVLVRAAESLKLLNVTKDLFFWQTGELRVIVYAGTGYLEFEIEDIGHGGMKHETWKW